MTWWKWLLTAINRINAIHIRKTLIWNRHKDPGKSHISTSTLRKRIPGDLTIYDNTEAQRQRQDGAAHEETCRKWNRTKNPEIDTAEGHWEPNMSKTNSKREPLSLLCWKSDIRSRVSHCPQKSIQTRLRNFLGSFLEMLKVLEETLINNG